MKYSEFKEIVQGLEEIRFALPNGEVVPAHYHVTEVGEIHKKFIDCGGTIREETVVNFQLWYSTDYQHRLSPAKMNQILEVSDKHLNIGDHEIEVEYQMETIGKFALEFDGEKFILAQKQTTCLAPDQCDVPVAADLSSMVVSGSTCTPGGGCC